jgi:hypothetical protein
LPHGTHSAIKSILVALRKVSGALNRDTKIVSRSIDHLENEIFIPDEQTPMQEGTAPSQNSKPKAKRGAKSKPGETPKWLAEALVELKNNPASSNAAIARRVKVDKSLLSKSKAWKQAKEALFDGVHNPNARGKKRERSNQFNDQFNDDRES